MPARKQAKLETYRKKRKADRTAEPFGGAAATGAGLFVVQKHDATRLHYDLRLEIDGVLKSWAVPKGPSPNPAEKRFAVAVEDHPVEYARFEGVIPDGNYGAGAVIVWDRGSWEPVEDIAEGFEKGKLLFRLNGYKLRGRWTLIKTKQGEKDWLLIKERDAYATDGSTDSYPADSILSGRTVEEVGEGKDAGASIRRALARAKASKQTVDASSASMTLAKPAEPFSRAGWIFEFKYDGYRLWVSKDGDTVTLYSRNGNDLTQTFPEIAEAAAALPYKNFIIDGEAVAHGHDGLPSFSRLQKRGRLRRVMDIRRAAIRDPVTLYAFDLVSFEEYDLRTLTLLKRKQYLKKILPNIGPIRYSEHIEKAGEAMYEQVSSLGMEGLVAKRADSRYVSGRSDDWLKIRVDRTDDFAVIGFTDPKGSQQGFGALLLGQYRNSELVCFGRVGTGFETAAFKTIQKVLDGSKKMKPPDVVADIPDPHWREPQLVVEVRYKEVTPDGNLRHPVFLRLRDDKATVDCTIATDETELPVPSPDDEPESHLVLSNLDKTFWPEDGYTKGDLLEYYRSISGWLLPYLKDRPLVMTRYPDGIDGKNFFQKDAPSWVPDWVRTETMWSEDAEREVRYFVADDVDTLLYVINMGTIPLHIWGSRIATLERPDWCILDLDPKEAPFKHVVTIAKHIHGMCEDIGLPNFIKTTGSSGLHVLIPLGAQYPYEQCRNLAHLIATVVSAELPDIATIVRSPAKREGKVYVDYGQNGHGRLLVSPFCVRPFPGAPVSMPMRWSEVTGRLKSSQHYTIKNAIRRMKTAKKDPMSDVLKLKPDLMDALARLRERVQSA